MHASVLESSTGCITTHGSTAVRTQYNPITNQPAWHEHERRLAVCHTAVNMACCGHACACVASVCGGRQTVATLLGVANAVAEGGRQLRHFWVLLMQSFMLLFSLSMRRERRRGGGCGREQRGRARAHQTTEMHPSISSVITAPTQYHCRRHTQARNNTHTWWGDSCMRATSLQTAISTTVQRTSAGSRGTLAPHIHIHLRTRTLACLAPYPQPAWLPRHTHTHTHIRLDVLRGQLQHQLLRRALQLPV